MRFKMRPHRAIYLARVRGRHHAQYHLRAGERFRKRSRDFYFRGQLESGQIDFVDTLAPQQFHHVGTVRPYRQTVRARRTCQRNGQRRAPASAAADTDASETYRQKRATITKTATAAATPPQEIIRKTPSAVATPLPPENFSHTGKTWPKIAASPAYIMNRMLPSEKCPASQTAKNPFAASRTSVATPMDKPAVRATLAAPMFPLPIARTSPPLRARTSKYPN